MRTSLVRQGPPARNRQARLIRRGPPERPRRAAAGPPRDGRPPVGLRRPRRHLHRNEPVRRAGQLTRPVVPRNPLPPRRSRAPARPRGRTGRFRRQRASLRRVQLDPPAGKGRARVLQQRRFTRQRGRLTSLRMHPAQTNSRRRRVRTQSRQLPLRRPQRQRPWCPPARFRASDRDCCPGCEAAQPAGRTPTGSSSGSVWDSFAGTAFEPEARACPYRPHRLTPIRLQLNRIPRRRFPRRRFPRPLVPGWATCGASSSATGRPNTPTAES